MPEQTPVLIVGAGPVGLTMAAALHQHGVDYRIIDKRAEQTQTSNAAVIHSRSMEMLDDLGIIDTFIKRGQRIDNVSVNRGKTNLAKIPTAQIDSHYNFMLSIPQNISEEILNHDLEKVGKPVERNQTLTTIKQTNDGIIADIVDANQQTEQIHCRYLVACDGSHSTVRELLDVPFTGTDIEQQFILADAHIPTDYPDNEFTIYFHPDGPLAVFPFKNGKARILATMIDSDHDPKQPVSLLEVQAIADKRSANQLKVLSANWMSSFWIHSKMLGKFRKNNIFFVGDAAHIHSPAGGQGMNTGMQDAYNLAWKLALSLKDVVKSNLLDSYDEERKPNATTLLSNTERMTTMILIRNPILQWLRQKVLKFFMKKETVQHAFIMEMSMLKVHYEKSPVINYEFHVSPKGPLPGHRAPDVHYSDRNGPKRMDDLLRTTKHTLLIFTGKNPTETDIAKIRKLDEWAAEHTDYLKPVIIVHPSAASQFSDQDPIDTHENLHKTYHVVQPCFYIWTLDKSVSLPAKTIRTFC